LTTIERMRLPVPDYDADDVLIVSDNEQLRALSEEVRLRIVALLRERALSTTELAAEVGLAKGTVSHHLKVLEAAGLIRVVRTRKVRALTESFYGRVARLYLLKGADEAAAHLRIRLSATDARRFRRRLERLRRDVEAASSPRGEEHELVAELFPAGIRT